MFVRGVSVRRARKVELYACLACVLFGMRSTPPSLCVCMTNRSRLHPPSSLACHCPRLPPPTQGKRHLPAPAIVPAPSSHVHRSLIVRSISRPLYPSLRALYFQICFVRRVVCRRVSARTRLRGWEIMLHHIERRHAPADNADIAVIAAFLASVVPAAAPPP